jgi:hypothetical protein
MALKRERLAAFRREKMEQLAAKRGGASIGSVQTFLWVAWNTVLFTPVAVWVWTPMEFLGEPSTAYKVRMALVLIVCNCVAYLSQVNSCNHRVKF